MAGHSKWANIKHRKGRQDEKRQKVFSKLIRELTVAAKLGGPVPGDNPRVRLALDKSLGAKASLGHDSKMIFEPKGSAGIAWNLSFRCGEKKFEALLNQVLRERQSADG